MTISCDTHGFVNVGDMNDHVLARWLRARGWTGTYHQLDNWNQFINENGTVIALVEYKNSPPIGKTVHLKEGM